MGKKKSEEPQDPLSQLIRASDATILGQLVRQLASGRPEVRRECLEFLQQHVSLTAEARADADADAVFALWEELEPDLADLNEYGGGPDETEERVAELLYQLSEKLKHSRIPEDARWDLLDRVMPYIINNHAGMEDGLYDVAYAACQEDDDLRELAIRMETSGRDYLVDHARGIYRKLGDWDKYLALRSRRMEYGGDYHDLATFYWEHGERERALALAREGMQKGKGRMDELRAFLAERARESGDRPGYLELQLAETISGLSLEKYKAFRELCTAEEWSAYEPRLLAALENARDMERLEIHMHRSEHDRAIAILSAMRFPDSRSWSPALLQIAAQLEDKYPEQILTFYRSGLGNLNRNDQRKGYAARAAVARLVRHVWVDVLRTPEQWESFARKVKAANRGRPAFQEEFARVVPGWDAL